MTIRGGSEIPLLFQANFNIMIGKSGDHTEHNFVAFCGWFATARLARQLDPSIYAK